MAKEVKELNPLEDGDLMPMGKHKGIKMIDVPADYLLYMDKMLNSYPRVRAYIEENREVLIKQAKQN